MKTVLTIAVLALALAVSQGQAQITSPSTPKSEAGPKPSAKPAPLKRLSPQERRELLHQLSRRLPADPEKLRRLTNSAPRQVEGRVDRTAERVNAALNASKQAATPAP